MKRSFLRFLSFTLALACLCPCIAFAANEGETYSVEFYWDKAGEDADNGYTAYSAEFGEKLKKPADPEREGQVFLGWNDWYTEQPVDFSDLYMDSENGRKFYAVWEKKYSITYFVDSNEYKKDCYSFGEAVEIPVAPEKEGFDFVGWTWKMGVLTVVVEQPQTMPAADLVAYATYEPKSYKATFYVDSKVHAQINNIYGEAFISPRLPEKDGYTFKCWTPKPPQTTPAYDTTFHAVFEPNRYVCTFLVDGEIYKQVEYTYGQKSVSLPPIPEKKGYTGEWESYSLGIGGVEINAIYTPIGEIRSVKIDDIKINYKSETTLQAAVEADEGVEYSVRFISSDPDIAEIDIDGTIHAKKCGTTSVVCIVTDMYGNEFCESCEVTVKFAWWQWLVKIFLFGFLWY